MMVKQSLFIFHVTPVLIFDYDYNYITKSDNCQQNNAVHSCLSVSPFWGHDLEKQFMMNKFQR